MKRKAICLLLAALMTLGAAGPVYAAVAPDQTPAPVETEAPAGTEGPIETEVPVETELPSETEAPAETEVPLATETPDETEAPVETEEPAETEMPIETVLPAVTDAPAPAEAARDIPLWVEDPDWSIQDWVVDGKRYSKVLYDNQTVPAGTVIDLVVRTGHDVNVDGGTLVYTTETPDDGQCLTAQIQVNADATHLYVHVYEADRDVMRPPIRYVNNGEEDLILYTNKIRNLPEGGRFPVYVKQGARLRAEGGSVEYVGLSDAQAGYCLYYAEVDPDAETVTVIADPEGTAVLRIDDASGKAVVRLAADTPGAGQMLTDGYTFIDRILAEVRRPGGYLAVATAECDTYDHAAVPGRRTEMYDYMYLSDADWDGEVTVTVVPTVKVALELPEKYPEEASPTVKYSVDGSTWEDAFEREVPAGSQVLIAVHKDYVLTAEGAGTVLDGGYVGKYHWYRVTAPAGGSLEVKVEEETDSPFTDVTAKDWYYKSVMHAYEEGIVNGMTKDTFKPWGTASRAQTVTMLHRLAGTPEPEGSAPFGDLKQEYYKKAVAWAATEGVVTGMSSTVFDPDSNVTREQLAVMLYRMAGSPAVSGDRLSQYKDGGSVDGYARDGMRWALEKGIMEGDTGGTLRPAGSATRAEVCTMLMRFKDAGLTWQPSPKSDWVKDLKAAAGTDQLLIAAAEGTTCSVTAYEKSGGAWKKVLETEGYVGAGGVGKASEGDDKTPVGQYKFIKAFGIQDDPGCAIPYTKLNDSHYWVDDSKSKYYNQFVSTDEVEPDWSSAEHLAAVGAPYNYVLALDYNSQRIPGEGSAIFLHCSSGEPTLGCVAIPEEDMVKVMQWVKSSCVVIIDSPECVKNY